MTNDIVELGEKSPEISSRLENENNGLQSRQRKVSGDNSLGEKSLMRQNPDWLLSPKPNTPIFNSCLCSLDEVVATPCANVNAFESAFGYKFYEAINESSQWKLWDGSLGFIGAFAVSIGVYVQRYSKLRETERKSDFFYFARLFKLLDKEQIEKKMGDIKGNQLTYAHLRAVAYFYPPDISKLACWKRRIFCRDKEKKELKKILQELLKQTPSKKEKIKEIHHKIIEKLSNFLNQGEEPKKFIAQKNERGWNVGLENNYSKQFFGQVDSLIKENAAKEKNIKKNNFITPILGAMGQASFIYWILMFIFYFIPSAPAVVLTAAMLPISVIPLGIALLVAFPTILILNLHNTYRVYTTHKKIANATIEKRHREMLEKKIVELNKQQRLIQHLREIKDKQILLKDSPLLKDLKAVLKKSRWSYYQAVFMGFVDGCFFPFFAGWLFLDGAKVIITYAMGASAVAGFTPISVILAMIITGVTFILGISYGIYSAIKASKEHKKRFKDLTEKVKALEQEAANEPILNKSLCDYDRFLRRFSEEKPIWTKIKKGLSRLLIVIKRLGTGSLIFRLVIWGSITAFVSISGGGIPIVAGTAIFAIGAAIWYFFGYNLESKAKQAGRMVEHLVQSAQLHSLGNLKLGELIQDSSIMVNIPNEIRVTSELSNTMVSEEQVLNLPILEENNQADQPALAKSSIPDVKDKFVMANNNSAVQKLKKFSSTQKLFKEPPNRGGNRTSFRFPVAQLFQKIVSIADSLENNKQPCDLRRYTL